MTTESAPAVTLDELRREFPDWFLWLSDAGRYWATSKLRRIGRGLERTIDGDTPELLRIALTAQEQIREAVQP